MWIGRFRTYVWPGLSIHGRSYSTCPYKIYTKITLTHCRATIHAGGWWRSVQSLSFNKSIYVTNIALAWITKARLLLFVVIVDTPGLQTPSAPLQHLYNLLCFSFSRFPLGKFPFDLSRNHHLWSSIVIDICLSLRRNHVLSSEFSIYFLFKNRGKMAYRISVPLSFG